MPESAEEEAGRPLQQLRWGRVRLEVSPTWPGQPSWTRSAPCRCWPGARMPLGAEEDAAQAGGHDAHPGRRPPQARGQPPPSQTASSTSQVHRPCQPQTPTPLPHLFPDLPPLTCLPHLSRPQVTSSTWPARMCRGPSPRAGAEPPLTPGGIQSLPALVRPRGHSHAPACSTRPLTLAGEEILSAGQALDPPGPAVPGGAPGPGFATFPSRGL